MSKYQFLALSSLGTRTLPELLRFHLDCVYVEIGNVGVARRQPLWRQAARIQARTAAMQFVATPVWQWEDGVTPPTLAKASDRSITR